MAAESTGRRLGIGLRLAAKAAQRGAAHLTASTTSGRSTTSAQTAYRAAAAYTAPATAKAKGVARGAKKFGTAVWGPFAHTSGVLWLEITGLFFALFALFFGQNVYKMRQNYAAGPEHIHFLIYSALTVAFTWFTFHNFYKARKKEKQNRSRQI